MRKRITARICDTTGLWMVGNVVSMTVEIALRCLWHEDDLQATERN